MKVELFTSGRCPACKQAQQRLNQVLDELAQAGMPFQVQYRLVPKEIDRAVELGVKALPALAIDDRLVLTGLPDTATLHKLLKP